MIFDVEYGLTVVLYYTNGVRTDTRNERFANTIWPITLLWVLALCLAVFGCGIDAPAPTEPEIATCKSIGCTFYDCTDEPEQSAGLCLCDLFEDDKPVVVTCRRTDEPIL